MRLLPVIALSLALLTTLASAGCKDSGTTSGGASEAVPAEHAAIHQKLIGTWVAEDGGEIYELTADRFKATHPRIEGSKPMEGPYKLLKVEGNEVTISQTLDLGEGKSFPVDDQIITIVDDDTIERHNAKNAAGGRFKRQKQ